MRILLFFDRRSIPTADTRVAVLKALITLMRFIIRAWAFALAGVEASAKTNTFIIRRPGAVGVLFSSFTRTF